ncbi:MAG: hypothetical protein RJA70_811 [Pseudomonadota bacterium]
MIVVLGVSHKTAPIEVRETAAMAPALVTEVLSELVSDEAVGEALIVSTCNRVEVVAAGRSGDPAKLDQVSAAVKRALLKRVPAIAPHLYIHQGQHAIQHLFRVVASLDSLVLGEPQILGQMKQAYELARHEGTVGAHLNRVVAHALRAAKRVRSETSIGAGQVSVPTVAIDLARQIFGDLHGHPAALLGSGQMGEHVAKLLVAAGASLQVVGRNQARVSELASQMGGDARTFDQLPKVLTEADVVVTTTSAPGFVVTRDVVDSVRRQRRGRSLFFIDLAVPRDVEPAVGDLDNTFLYNVDDLSKIVAESLSTRKREAEAAEAIVMNEAVRYERAIHAEQVTPTILALRKQFGQSLESELDKTLRTRLKHLSHEERDALHIMLDSALNKLLHPATKHLRRLATDDEAQADVDAHIAALTDLFSLDVTSEPRASESPAARQKRLSLSADAPPPEMAPDNEKQVS